MLELGITAALGSNARERDALLDFVVPLVVHAVVGVVLASHLDVLGRHFGLTKHLRQSRRAGQTVRTP